MTKEEMCEYLISTGLYDKGTAKHPYTNLFNEKRLMETDKTIPIKELVERFIKIDKEFKGESWNIRQILANIDIIIPVEDRKEENNDNNR